MSRWYAGVADQGLYRSLASSYATSWAAYGSGITGSIKRISLAASESDTRIPVRPRRRQREAKLNGVYRSGTHGVHVGEDLLPVPKTRSSVQMARAGTRPPSSAIPADPAHVFFGITNAVEIDERDGRRRSRRTSSGTAPFDGGHADLQLPALSRGRQAPAHRERRRLLLLRRRAASIPNAVGNLLGINALELGGAKTTASVLHPPGRVGIVVVEPGRVRSQVFRTTASCAETFPRIRRSRSWLAATAGTSASCRQTPRSSASPHNGAQHQRTPARRSDHFEKIDFNLPPEKSAPVLIDPTPPGLSTASYVFTAAQRPRDFRERRAPQRRLLQRRHRRRTRPGSSGWQRRPDSISFSERRRQPRRRLRSTPSAIEIVATIAGGAARLRLRRTAFSQPARRRFRFPDITPPLPSSPVSDEPGRPRRRGSGRRFNRIRSTTPAASERPVSPIVSRRKAERIS